MSEALQCPRCHDLGYGEEGTTEECGGLLLTEDEQKCVLCLGDHMISEELHAAILLALPKNQDGARFTSDAAGYRLQVTICVNLRRELSPS